MKSEVAQRLEILVQNSLLIEGVAESLSADGFSEIEFRAVGNSKNETSAWVIKIYCFNELILFEFLFDDDARDWNDFYFKELLKNIDEWETALDTLIKRNFVFDIQIDSTKISTTLLRDTELIGRFMLTSRFRLSQPPEVTNFVSYLDLIRDFISICTYPLIPTEDHAEQSSGSEIELLPEGSLTRVQVNKYERNPRNRAACLAHFGFKCFCCGFDFGLFYGDFADSYIHVHHLTPVSELGPNYKVNPIKDLVPLCPNCHAAVHIKNPPMSPAALRMILENKR